MFGVQDLGFRAWGSGFRVSCEVRMQKQALIEETASKTKYEAAECSGLYNISCKKQNTISCSSAPQVLGSTSLTTKPQTLNAQA